MVDKAKLDAVRAKGWNLLGKLGGVGATLAKVNDALGRPLAPSEELADCRAFADGQQRQRRCRARVRRRAKRQRQ